MKSELLQKYIEQVGTNVTDIPSERLKSLRNLLHDELRYRWHHGFQKLLQYLSEKYMQSISIGLCEPYQLWLCVQDTSFKFLNTVVLKTVDTLSDNYSLVVRIHIVNPHSEFLVPYQMFEKQKNREEKATVLFGIDIPHEDYYFFARLFDGVEVERALPAKLLESLEEGGSIRAHSWPPTSRECLPGHAQWPQLHVFPNHEEIESRILPAILEKLDK